MENSIISSLTERVEALIVDSTLFLVDIKIKPTNNIKIYIDGDNGVTIDAVSRINRALYKQLEESTLFPEGDFSLEVSSPGIDEPLKFLRQYHKNIGRTVAVTLLTEDKTVEGVLETVTDDAITLKITINKKKETLETVIPFDQIKKTVVKITF
jgi:ribosome maturation factor RimP